MYAFLQYVITFNVTFDIVLLRNELGSFLCYKIGRVCLARENDDGGSWGKDVDIFHVNI